MESASLLAPNLSQVRETLGLILFTADEEATRAEPIIVAIKGGWGEGKTYFWKKTIVADHPKHTPGYASVFGSDSLGDIRNQVVIEATTTHEQVKDILDDRIRKRGPIAGSVTAIAGFIAKLKGVPSLPSGLVSGVMEHFIFRKGWVLCIDDIERLSSKVDFEAFLGYVNSLRDDRGINVVLIYNEEKVTGDRKKKETFEKYLEKIVDREFTFKPNINDVLQFVFSPDVTESSDLLNEVERRCIVLGLRNIRILKRVSTFYTELKKALPDDADSDYLSAGLYSLLLFCWIKFARDDAADYKITFEYLLEQSYYSEAMLTFVAEKSGDSDDVEDAKRTGKLLDDFGYSHTDDYDRVLMNFVRTSVLDTDALDAEYAKYLDKVDLGTLHDQFEEPWKKLYHGTLQDNEIEFGDQLLAATEAFLPRMGLNQLDTALIMLSKLDRKSDADKLFDRFMEIRGGEISEMYRESMMEPLKFAKLRMAVDDTNKQSAIDMRSLHETIEAAIGENFIRDAERRRLCEFSVEEFVDYFTSTDRDHLTGLLRHIRDYTAQSSDEAGRKVHQTIMEVARIIAGQSRLNRLRMESMGFTDFGGEDRKDSDPSQS